MEVHQFEEKAHMCLPGFYADESPHPIPPEQHVVSIAPEEMPWELHRENYCPDAYAYFVKEVEAASKIGADPLANENARLWAVIPVRIGLDPLLGKMEIPMIGAAWFTSRDLAVAYWSQLRLGWEAWCVALALHRSVSHIRFALAGPWTRADIMTYTADPCPIQLLRSKEVSPNLYDGKVPLTRDGGVPMDIMGTRLSELNGSLSQEQTSESGSAKTPKENYDKMLKNILLGIERFPSWWLSPDDVPRGEMVSDAESACYAKDKPWRPTVIVPWVEFRNKEKKGCLFIQPTPQPLAYFEHDGLAADFACALAYAIGHVCGRKPEEWEQPWMFNQIYVYSKMTLGNMWGKVEGKLKFPAWCKTHPPIFTAALSQAGVSTSVSESGFASDNAAIPLTTAMGNKIIQGYVRKTGEQVRLEELLDVPPTPNTEHAMQEDFPHDEFANAFNSFPES